MYKPLGTLFLLIVFFLGGCSSVNTIDNSELDAYEVKQTEDETTENDFTFRLVSDKETYAAGEDIALYGELKYTGEKEEIEILHGSSVFSYHIEERVRGYQIGGMIKEIGVWTSFKRGKTHRGYYNKSSSFAENQDNDDYMAFMEEFLQKDGFPPGYYVITGTANFFVESDDEDEQQYYEMEAQVDFKVQ